MRLLQSVDLLTTGPSKTSIPELVTVGIETHHPTIYSTKIGRSLIPGDRGCRPSTHDYPTVASDVQAVGIFIVAAAKRSIPKLVAAGIQSDYPEIGSAQIGT